MLGQEEGGGPFTKMGSSEKQLGSLCFSYWFGVFCKYFFNSGIFHGVEDVSIHQPFPCHSEFGKERDAVVGVHTLGSGRPSAFWSGYLGLVCFSDGESPKQIWGLPAGVGGHGQSGLALLCFVWKPHSWGHSWGAGALFSSWLPSVAQAGGPMSETPCPGKGG